MFCSTIIAAGAASIFVGAGVSVAEAADQPLSFSLASPALDRWNYPFNQTPGYRPTASVWGAFLDDDLSPDFDNRDAQMHIAFDTAGEVEPGLGPEAYTITSAVVTITAADDDSFVYDPTSDPWQSYLPEDDPEYVDDTTPGRPAELFGVGFRNGHDAASYEENTTYSPSGQIGKSIRTTYAVDLPDGGKRDVSNNIDKRFETHPFAIATTDEVSPGESVPSDTQFAFALNVDDPHVHAYLQQALDEGAAHFMIASLFPASEDFSGAFPQYYCKEHPLVIKGLADAAGLVMTVVVDKQPDVVGDLNRDGAVNVSDLLILLGAWGACPDGGCDADLNSDSVVNVSDMLVLLANWG